MPDYDVCMKCSLPYEDTKSIPWCSECAPEKTITNQELTA